MINKNKTRAKIRDLTKGSVTSSLILFALPLFGTSLIQQLYNSVDMIFVGNLISKEATAAVGSGSLLISCLIDFFIGLGVGVNILCARFFGAEDRKNLRIAIYTSVILAIVSSVILTIVGWYATPAILRWYKTPEEVFSLASSYMKIYFLSLTAIILFNVGSGILRALGDSLSPMIAQITGGCANIIGNTIFIYYMKLGVKGAAYATMLSQTVAMLMVVFYLTRLPEEYRLKTASFQLRMLANILKIGLPTAVQSMIITFSNLVMQTYINQLGVVSIAAYAAFYKVDAFIYLPQIAVGQALITFTSQNIGAEKRSRAKKGILVTWLLLMAIGLFLAGSLLIWFYPAFRMFSADLEVILEGHRIMLWAFAYYFLFGSAEALASSLRGSGYTFHCMCIMLISIFVIRLPLVNLLFNHFHSGPGIALAYPITWTFNTLCYAVLWYKVRHNFVDREQR